MKYQYNRIVSRGRVANYFSTNKDFQNCMKFIDTLDLTEREKDELKWEAIYKDDVKEYTRDLKLQEILKK